MCSCTLPSSILAVGIDVATRTGWAILGHGSSGLQLVDHGAVKVTNAEVVERLAEKLVAAGVSLVALEAPFVKSAARGGNPHSALELATMVGRFEQAFEVRGIVPLKVLASTWQPAITGCDRWANRETRKASAIRWALETLGADLPEDVADAACIAAWAHRRQGQTR